MAVETTKSRRDRLSMGHLLETDRKRRRREPRADGAKTRGPSGLFPAKIGCKGGRRGSHRLERAIELDVDEQGLAVLECMSNEIGGLMHGLGPLGRDTEGARQRNEVDLGIEGLHADIAVGLLRGPTPGMQAPAEDAVGAVVEAHEAGADAVVRGVPKSLAGVHRAAVADEAAPRPIGQSELHADRGRQAPADAAAAQAKVALRVIAADELADAGSGGE